MNDIDLAIWIPKEVKDQLKENVSDLERIVLHSTDKVVKRFRYLTKNNGIVIQNDTQRSRELNTDLCFEKLVSEIKNTVYFESEANPEDVKRWEKM